MTLPTDVVAGQTGAIADLNEAFASINLLRGVADPSTGVVTRITRPNTTDRLIEQWNPNKVGGAGWSIVDYHSGIRDIASLVTGTGFTVYSASIVRRSGFVDLEITVQLTGNALPSGAILTLPPGLDPRPTTGYNDRIAWQGDGGYLVLALIRSGAITLYQTIGGSPQTGHYIRLICTYACDEGVPASLPGTSLTPAPA